MGYLSWTKAWSANDNKTIFTGAHLGTLQSDIAAVLNGGISDANIAAAAAILESKLSFNITTGHRHDGTESRLVATSTFIATHFRRGCFVRRTGADTLSVLPGALEIGGAVYKVATATTLTGSTAGDYITGTEPTSATIYVYGYNNSGTLAFKMHTAAPNLSDTSDTVVEEPWRYLKSGSTYYRCVGAIWNDASQNFLAGTEVNFDASGVAVGQHVGIGADQIIPTIWTPDHVHLYGPSQDSTPANAEGMNSNAGFRYLMDDYTLTIMTEGNAGENHFQTNTTSGGNVKAITAQAAGTAGSFTIQSMTAGLRSYWVAFSKECG